MEQNVAERGRGRVSGLNLSLRRLLFSRQVARIDRSYLQASEQGEHMRNRLVPKSMTLTFV